MNRNRTSAKKCLASFFAMLIPLLTSAEVVEINGVWYNLVFKTKLAEVTKSGGAEYSGDIVIPATVTYNDVEYRVTTIGESVFYFCSNLTSITIPEGVTSIGNYAFFACSGLIAVHISDIESWCRVTFGDFHSNPITEAHNLYLNGKLVTELMVPKGVTSIKKNAFSGCDCLTSISFPEDMNSVGEAAFSNCVNLTCINFPKGNLSIGGGAFSGCRSLTSVTFWRKVSLGANVFSNCSNLASIILSEGITSISDRVFYGCNSLTSIIIPEGVATIGNYAFYGCCSLASISIPESVTSIGYNAFKDCSILTTILLPKKLKYIGSQAFANCSELLDVYCYAESVPSANTDAFDGSYPEYATLHVPTSVLASNKTTAPWSGFGKFETLEVAVESITLSQSSATLTEGEELMLTTTVDPDDATDKSYTWSSSNPSVATVDNTGKVTAVAPGTATITAMANDGSGVSALCEVTVKELILGKCATPRVMYNIDGRLLFTCATEGAEIKTNVVIESDTEYIGTEIRFTPIHTFTTYATKAKYEDSDEATYTLCWFPCPEGHELGDDNGILTIPSKPVLIQSQSGTITLSGLAADTEVSAYDAAGNLLDEATSTDGGAATLATNLAKGDIVIVKIGSNNIKVIVR